ncbi:hypothetical protein GCM10010531_39340 [Blastococcus jejuensis]|uniref:Uncharacterized protein n=1 Tax=Blastococcus jejuensis TaxID=351224 RepID=A0ABP6PKD4_9ACTN
MEELFETLSFRLLDQPLLSPPPRNLAEGEAVVIARWIGPQWGALLSVINSGPDEDDGELTVHLDATGYRRVPGGWRESLSSGGTNWWTTETPLLRRPEMHARAWTLHHFHVSSHDGLEAHWAIGVAGDAAAWVEVTDVDGPVRQPLEAPLGSFVVAWNGVGPATVELFDRPGSSLGRIGLPRVP